MGIKRCADIALATVGLVLTGPLLLVTALLVRWKLGSPVLFRHRRPGLGGEPFTLYKFRTMTDARDAEGDLLDDEARMTPFGQRLRSTSLDELPELFCVLTGRMSLVGPRPLMMKYLPLYNARQARRHEMKPGITGWAQVNGRNNVPWEQRLEMDVWYVENWTLLLDLRILLRTLLYVVKREDVSPQGHVTMEEFKGTPPRRQSGESSQTP
ncbi:MAG: sugar transferase [Planctomycetota bacterium]